MRLSIGFMKLPAAFCSKEGKPCWQVVLLFAVVNLIVAFNTVVHDPSIGYDAWSHHQYVHTLARARLPTLQESREFFCPPLPYVVPAIVYRGMGHVCRWLGWNSGYAALASYKAGQSQNLVASILLTFFVLKICDVLRPGDVFHKLLTLLFLGILPVYYKTFAMVRGEPLVAVFTVLSCYLVLLILKDGLEESCRKWILLGISLGLLILSRQWGFFLLPAAVLVLLVPVLRHRGKLILVSKRLALTLAIAFIVGGWFYVTLQARFGSVTAFNRELADDVSLANRPVSFYVGLGLPDVFRRPVRPAFRGEFWPVFYSEVWGDYFGYFVYTSFPSRPRIAAKVMNGPGAAGIERMGNYLGRVNLACLPITLLLLVGWAHAARHWRSVVPRALPGTQCKGLGEFFLFVSVCAFAGGYAWFLLMTGAVPGGTIKATYMLHTFPLTAVLASGMMVRLRAERRALLCFCVIMLLIAAVHVLPICFSRYSVFDHLKFYTAPDEYFAKKAWVPAEGRLPAVLTAGARD